MTAADHLKTPLGLSLNKFAEEKAKRAIQQTGRSLPCSVVKVVSSGIVTVKFEVDSAPWTLPNITIPIFGSRYVRLPIQEGDKGCAFAADARLGGISGLGGGVASLKQPANLTGLMFAWCGSKEWEAPENPNAVVVMGPDGAILRTDDGAVKVSVTAAGVVVTGDTGFFGATPAPLAAVVGALTSVTDANAKAVLTSLITALAGYGLITNSTT